VTQPRTRDPKALFLGPVAENSDMLRALANWAIDKQIEWRRDNAKRFNDPETISNADKEMEQFVETKCYVCKTLVELFEGLKKSTEVYSPRYIPHMVSDPLIPAVMGYFAGMLCNQNNIVSDVSESTFSIEQEVIQQLAHLLGFIQTEDDKKNVKGYLTSGGTVANFQALWVARNKAYFPIGIRDMVRKYDTLGYKLEVPVKVGDKEFEIRELAESSLLDIPPTKVNAMYEELLRSAFAAGALSDDLKKMQWQRNLLYSAGLRALGLWQEERPGIIICSVGAHYSIMKVCEALGIGIEQCKLVDTDENFRMKTSDLKNKLEQAREKSWKVMAVVATTGTTETGSVDPLEEILELQKQYQFLLHVDAAWGGYACSVPKQVVGEDVWRNLKAIGRADSAAVDPHKLGYVPYSCGAVIFKNWIDLEYVASVAPYLFHPGVSPEVRAHGQYTLEGSRGGARATACWAAHKTVGLDENGYGRIIGDTIILTKKLAFKLRNLPKTYSDVIRLMHTPDLNLLCFTLQFPGCDGHKQDKINKDFCEAVNEERKFLVSYTDELRQSASRELAPLAIRVCIANPFTSEQLIDQFVEDLKKYITDRRKALREEKLATATD
jgi:glutamate/tyrosine decarboxylase-like PLP-dependent enzyme